jgi:hypothetical protein
MRLFNIVLIIAIIFVTAFFVMRSGGQFWPFAADNNQLNEVELNSELNSEFNTEVNDEADAAANDETQSAQNSISYPCIAGLTAFAAMTKQGFEVDYTESSFGKLVNSINGVEPAGGKYWLYSIDGQEATVGADAYECEGDELIEWELK